MGEVEAIAEGHHLLKATADARRRQLDEQRSKQRKQRMAEVDAAFPPLKERRAKRVRRRLQDAAASLRGVHNLAEEAVYGVIFKTATPGELLKYVTYMRENLERVEALVKEVEHLK
jgi:hypothetical protein